MKALNSRFWLLCVLSACFGTSNAFQSAVMPQQRLPVTVLAARKSLKEIKDIPYGEQSRPYRRTVYSHDDWVKHRSQDRFFYYIIAMLKSGVYKNIVREVFVTTFVAISVFGFNIAATGYTDLAGVQHGPLVEGLQNIRLPLTPFTLASPSLGLLLVFRTNSSYKRWDEARKNWGMNINHTRDLVRMATTFYDSNGVSPEERQADLDYVALCTWSFVRAMKRHLSPEEEDELAFQAEIREKLPRVQAQKIIDAAHRPNRALQDLSYAIDNLPMHFMRKNEIQKAVTIFEDNLGSSERLLTSPVPVSYSRDTARFVIGWLLFLPLALYDPFAGSWNHIMMIPASSLLSVFLFGIEELATQLEEPFTILPMQAFCDKIYNWCMEIVSWSPGDNGSLKMRTPRPEHSLFVDAPPPMYTDQPNGQVNGYTAPPQQQAPPPQQTFAAAPNGVSGSAQEAPPQQSFEPNGQNGFQVNGGHEPYGQSYEPPQEEVVRQQSAPAWQSGPPRAQPSSGPANKYAPWKP